MRFVTPYTSRPFHSYWQEITKKISGYRPLPEDQIILVGARDFDKTEHSRLESSEITHIHWDELRKLGVDKSMNSALYDLSRKVDHVYVHVDMDVHDVNQVPANLYNKPEGGLTPMEVRDAIRTIASRFNICGASVTAFDPDEDEENKGLCAGIELIELICEMVSKQHEKKISS